MFWKRNVYDTQLRGPAQKVSCTLVQVWDRKLQKASVYQKLISACRRSNTLPVCYSTEYDHVTPWLQNTTELYYYTRQIQKPPLWEVTTPEDDASSTFIHPHIHTPIIYSFIKKKQKTTVQLHSRLITIDFFHFNRFGRADERWFHALSMGVNVSKKPKKNVKMRSALSKRKLS